MTIQELSYLYGLFGTDGAVYRTSDEKGIARITLEVIDEDIV